MLVGLYEEPERPSNAIEYIKKYLGNSSSTIDSETLQKENESLRGKIKELTEKLEMAEQEREKALENRREEV